LSLKGANSPTRGGKLRSTGTKAGAHVSDEPNSLIELKKQLEARTRELAEAREQQTAASEVLRVISSSPGELQPVFEAMLGNAARLCEAKFGTLYLCEGDALRIVAAHNAPSAFVEARRRGPFRPAPSSALGKLIRTKQTVQIADTAATQLMPSAIQRSSTPSSLVAFERASLCRCLRTMTSLEPSLSFVRKFASSRTSRSSW